VRRGDGLLVRTPDTERAAPIVRRHIFDGQKYEGLWRTPPGHCSGGMCLEPEHMKLPGRLFRARNRHFPVGGRSDLKPLEVRPRGPSRAG
jgi:hypothetical protein